MPSFLVNLGVEEEEKNGDTITSGSSSVGSEEKMS